MPSIIAFYSHVRGDHRAFSNFYPARIVLDGYTWATTEHYYQANKFTPGGEKFMLIQRNSDPFFAAAMGRSREGEQLRHGWEEAKDAVMAKALRAKFTQHPELGDLLVSTGDAILAEASPRDAYWGWGRDKQGLNRLGELLMQLRSEIAAGRDASAEEPSPNALGGEA